MRKAVIFFIFIVLFWVYLYAQEEQPSPITINGDKLEYLSDVKQWVAEGNVEVIYKGAKLTCEKLSVDPQTKVGTAEGNVRLDDKLGVIEGEKIIYNFETKTGVMVDSGFRANPYFGRSEKVEKVNEFEFIAFNGYATTCSFDSPHYRLKSKRINMFPNDKIQTRKTTFRLGRYPLFYLPWYSHSLKEPFMHMRMVPGKSKDWGPYLLTASRYSLTNNLSGRIYLDYREKLGVAEGFGANYNTPYFGTGDFKYYYTQERSRFFTQEQPAEFQRYFIRLRHKWDISEQTNVTAELYKISDEKRKLVDPAESFLKDYFFREYEKDSQPLTYALFHHAFKHSSIDILAQKRINHWFDQLDKLPQVSYSLPSIKIGDSPVYFDNGSSLANLNKKATTSPASLDEESATRLDTTNKLSLPTRVAFFSLTPFVSSRQTVYDKAADGSNLPLRTIFYTGADVSTKFYRIFDVEGRFLGMEINKLRHIITPNVGYAYNHEPTLATSKIKQIETDIDSINCSNKAALELSNKLQTKRKGQSVDFVDFLVKSDYIFKPKTGDKLGSNLQDILYDLNFSPYSWLGINSEITYKHSGNRSDANYNHFSNVNYDINFNFANERSFAIGQRYQRKGSNELISNLNWRFNPKWKFSVYHRYEIGHDYSLESGLREQEYIISRDLHCWTIQITYNVKRSEGESMFLVFSLKAFPEMEFGFDQTYHQPKPGSQSY